MSKRDLESELSSLLPYEVDLLLPAPELVVVRTLSTYFLAVLQHSIDNSCEAVSHGSTGLWGAQFGSQSTVLGAEVSLTPDESARCASERRSSAINHSSCAPAQHLVSADAIIRAQPEPGSEGRLRFCIDSCPIPPRLSESERSLHQRRQFESGRLQISASARY